MTTFAELEALVIGQTRRPEVPAITKAAVKSAVLRAHHVDFFPRDLVTGSLVYAPTSAVVYYDLASISTLLPRLRALKFLQGLDASSFQVVEKLEWREADDIYDADGRLRPSVYTLIGDTLRVYPRLHTGRLAPFYYANPQTSESSFNSWIADMYPDEVALWAAGIVFARTGFAEQAQNFQETHVKPFKEMLVSSHLLGTVN
jgi:hypothetical protein